MDDVCNFDLTSLGFSGGDNYEDTVQVQNYSIVNVHSRVPSFVKLADFPNNCRYFMVPCDVSMKSN